MPPAGPTSRSTVRTKLSNLASQGFYRGLLVGIARAFEFPHEIACLGRGLYGEVLLRSALGQSCLLGFYCHMDLADAQYSTEEVIA